MNITTMCTKSSCMARKSCARFITEVELERGHTLFAIDPQANKHGSCQHFVANDLDKWPSKAKQVEFFEKKYVTDNMSESVPGWVEEVEYEGFHIVVMAENEFVALATLSSEMYEIQLANY